jgi:hypothetical protein
MCKSIRWHDVAAVNHAFAVLFCALWLAGCSVHTDTGPGAIRGRFLLLGDVPEPKAITVDKDVACCGHLGLVDEEVVVGPDHGLANVVVFIRSKNIPLPPGHQAKPTHVTVQGCRYVPHVSIVETGQEFVIRSEDPVGHNSNVATVKNSPVGRMIPTGSDESHTFSAPEAIPAQVTCNIHPWMKAWVVIRPNPYAAVSQSGGEFLIENVPSGTWELQFWHEKFGYIKSMSLDGAVKAVPKGRLSVEVGQNALDFGDIVLDYDTLIGQEAEPGVGADSR